MAGIIDLVQGQLGSEGISQISSLIGEDKAQTDKAVSAALPMLVGAASEKSRDEAGAQGLLGLLDRDGDGSVLDDIMGFLGPKGDDPVEKGQTAAAGLLGDDAEEASQGISKFSGISKAASGKLLAILAPMVLGAIMKKGGGGSFNLGSLMGLLGGERDNLRGGGVGDMLGGLLGGGKKSGGGLLGKIFG